MKEKRKLKEKHDRIKRNIIKNIDYIKILFNQTDESKTRCKRLVMKSGNKIELKKKG